MEHQRDIDFDVRATDYVTVRIHALAITMMVLFAVFAICDWLHILPQLPGAATP